MVKDSCRHHTADDRRCRLCEFEPSADGEVLILVTRPARDCPCALSFGRGFMCTCPTRKRRYREERLRDPNPQRRG